MAFVTPQLPPRWDHSEDDITNLTKQAMEKYQAVMSAVGALESRYCNFDSVFIALAGAHTDFKAVAEPLSFYQNVSASKEVRDASNKAESLVRDFDVESSMRLDVFTSKVAAEKNIRESGQWENLSPEEQRLVQKMVLDGKRNGLALPAEKREALTTLKKELSQVCLEFEKNLGEENGHVTFTEEELEGVPKDVISGYTKRTEEGKEVYDVTFKTPDIGPILGYAENPEVRKRAQEAKDSRLEINTPVLAKVMELRRQIAGLLGYNSWADYITEVKMVKTGKGAMDFLDDLENKLAPVGIKDREAHLAIKKKECEARGIPFDGKYYTWDYGYYSQKYVKETLDLDGKLVKEYFPVSHVVPVILEIYQSLLGVRFEDMKEASIWHPEVQAFAVWEKDAKDESGFVGYCYLDLFPRPGKYPNAAMWPIQLGYDLPDGKRNYPVCAIVANLAKPTPERPALMSHFDTVTLFHEVGHIFHELLSKTKFARFHGTTVALDFGEAPSQMLENWCWEPKVLKRISCHYETKQPMSPELIERLIKSRNVNVGSFNLLQIFFAKFDLKVHTDPTGEDYTHLWNSLRRKIWGLDYDKECSGQSAFGHLIHYDAGYYGYTYSLVFAADMYATVFKADPLDPARGKLYRDKILLPGASRDEVDILKDFLGRSPSSEAFLKQLFGTVPTAEAASVI